MAYPNSPVPPPPPSPWGGAAPYSPSEFRLPPTASSQSSSSPEFSSRSLSVPRTRTAASRAFAGHGSPFRSGGAAGVSFSVPADAVPRPLSTPPGRARVIARPVVDPTAGATQVMRIAEATDDIARTVLYTPLKNGTAKYFDLKKVDKDRLDKLDRGVHEIHQACQDRLGMSPDATHFRVNWTRHLIYYTDGRQQHVKSFEELFNSLGQEYRRLEGEKQRILLVDPDAEVGAIEAQQEVIKATMGTIDEAEKIAIVDIADGTLRTDQFADSGKGVRQGESSLFRPTYATRSSSMDKANSKAIQSLPLPPGSPERPAVVKTAMSRMFAAENMINTMKVHLTAEKTRLEAGKVVLIGGDPVNPVPPADPVQQHELAQIEQDLGILDSRLNELDRIDRDALSHVLAWYPTGADAENPRKVSQAAHGLSEVLDTEFEESRAAAEKEAPTRSWIPDWAPKVVLDRFRNPPLYRSPYPVQVGSLMFSGLSLGEGREYNLNYCRAQQASVTQDRIEDHIVRGILRPNEGAAIVADHLLEGITNQALRERLVADMVAEAQQMAQYDTLAVDEANINAFRTDAAAQRQAAGLPVAP